MEDLSLKNNITHLPDSTTVIVEFIDFSYQCSHSMIDTNHTVELSNFPYSSFEKAWTLSSIRQQCTLKGKALSTKHRLDKPVQNFATGNK